MLRFLLFFISFPGLSRLYGRLVRTERPRAFARWLVRFFARHYHISMEEFAGSLDDYATLSSFFVRPLDPVKRPLKKDPAHILAPADSILSVCETVTEDRATQVKGRTYRLSELVGEPLDLPAPWRVAVFYLSPKDYHRFHFPVDTRVVAARRDGARLYPVNKLAVPRIPNLFVQNERVTLKCRTAGHSWYYVTVGATFVGSIETAAGRITERERWMPVGKDFLQLDEAGRFNMGSTIVLVIPSVLAGTPLLPEGSPVRVGDPVWDALAAAKEAE